MRRKILICVYIIFFSFQLANAQHRSDATIKTVLIYKICNELIWQDQYSKDTFLIGVYGNDPLMLSILQNIETEQIQGKTVFVTHFPELQDIKNTDVLYINHVNNFDIERIYRLTKNTNTLLITDRNDQKRDVMINFFHDEGKVKFEINRNNIEEENIVLSPNLIVLGGTELDVRDLYYETEKVLATEQKKIVEIEKELKLKQEDLFQKQEELRKTNMNYNRLQNQIEIKNQDITALSERINEKEQMLRMQNSNITQSQEKFKRLSKNINALKVEHEEQITINAKKEASIYTLDSLIVVHEKNLDVQLKQVKEQEDIITDQKRIMIQLVGIGALLIIIIALIIYGYLQKKQMNTKLEKLVEERTKELKRTNINLVSEIKTRKKFESDLIDSERNYKEIYNTSTDAIFIHKMNGEFLDVNNSMLRMYGYQKEEVLNFNIGDVSAIDEGYTIEKVEQLVVKAIQDGMQTFDWKAKSKNGKSFWVEVVLKKTLIDDKERILAVVRDIDERKIAQIELEKYRLHLEKMVEERTYKLQDVNEELETSIEELAATNEELYSQREELQLALSKLEATQGRLVESEKMATVGKIAAGVAHEINNPLNFIQGGINAIHEILGEEQPETLAELIVFINAVETGIERAANIVKSLNVFSRKSDSMDEIGSISAIIDNCLVMLENGLKNKIEIQKDYKVANDTVIGNVDKLHQVFINLLTNAEQSIESKGRIHISATEKDKNKIEIKIRDNGKGIPPEVLNKIFDPFFTTKVAGEGTGLGLAIVKNIIQEHNGFVKLSSKLNEGTVVTILLPVK